MASVGGRGAVFFHVGDVVAGHYLEQICRPANAYAARRRRTNFGANAVRFAVAFATVARDRCRASADVADAAVRADFADGRCGGGAPRSKSRDRAENSGSAFG